MRPWTYATDPLDARLDGDVMRIVIIASWYPSEAGPVSGIFVRDQAEILSSRFDVAVVAPSIMARTTLRRSARASRPPSLRPDRVPTARPGVPMLPKTPTINEALYTSAVRRSIVALARSGPGVDVINAHVVLAAGAAASAVGRELGIPVVLTEHSSPFAMHLGSPRSAARVHATLLGVGRVVAVSAFLAHEIRGVADIPVDVVGNVVAPAFFEAPLTWPRAEGARLLAIGLMTAQKRFDLLLRAFATARASRRELEIELIGDGPDRPALERLARELGIADRVHFAGLVTRETIVDRLAWADALVSASDHESFGLSIAEALAAGRPVITTASGGPEGFVERDTGVIVPRGDATALGGAIAELPRFLETFDPRVARDRMAERFGPDIFLDRMEAIFDNAVRRRGARDMVGSGPEVTS
jgi:glycosyltransferase involved in cell wall biosynthesis